MLVWGPLAKISCLCWVTLTTNAQDAAMISKNYRHRCQILQHNPCIIFYDFKFVLTKYSMAYTKRQHQRVLETKIAIRSSYHVYFAKITRT